MSYLLQGHAMTACASEIRDITAPCDPEVTSFPGAGHCYALSRLQGRLPEFSPWARSAGIDVPVSVSGEVLNQGRVQQSHQSPMEASQLHGSGGWGWGAVRAGEATSNDCTSLTYRLKKMGNSKSHT